MGGTYHIFLAYVSGLNFREYPHNSYGLMALYGTNVPPLNRILKWPLIKCSATVFWVVTASEVAVLATTFLPYDLEDKKPLVETPEEVRWFFTGTRNGGIATFSILYNLYIYI